MATASAWSRKSGEIIYPDRLLMLFAADVLERNPGALHHLRREVHRPPARPHPAPWRQPADVEDRAFADQGQDEGNRGRAGRRDERPLLLPRALVRLRRRPVCRRAPAGDPRRVAGRCRDDIRRSCPRACRPRSSRSTSPRASSTRFIESFVAKAQVRGRAASRPSTACAPTGRMAGAWCAPPTPRRCLVLRFDAKDEATLARDAGGVPRTAAGGQSGPEVAVLNRVVRVAG